MADKQRVYPCNTCAMRFPTSESQRTHMRQEWHVSNLRRKIAGLPAEPEAREATLRIEPKRVHGRNHSDEAAPRESPLPSASDDGEQNLPPPTNCLFCQSTSCTIESNLTHMSTTHGLYMPSPERLSDLESFLTFLGRLVFEWHECLYCAAEKGSTHGVQTHMRDKGHCMVRTEDVRGFWEEEEEEEGRSVKKEKEKKKKRMEAATVKKKVPPRSRRRNRALVTTSPPTQVSSGDSHISLRATKLELSLAGISDHDRRLLLATDRKMASKAAFVQTRNRHRMVQAPVLTKYYKTENPVYMAG
ncbi:C2H2 type zinc-finger-domain-containing protein [Ampelomyces quisqualis]|uniref:C2H2 type zinc-finger-domain-containing protein n=1 Tax=Ampelomyces quisqualis TaxID=50730 RepID=A0A6A5QDJ9_AMPQU|nr:C2H2 type zinc-finger-domain-containing protein [Ampelomyces quisqualis]